VISVVVLQNPMDLQQCDFGSSRTTVTDAVNVYNVEEEVDQQATTVPEIKTEPEVSAVPVVECMHIYNRLNQNCLPLYLGVLVKQKFECRDWILSSF